MDGKGGRRIHCPISEEDNAAYVKRQCPLNLFFVCFSDVVAVRVRETPPRNGVGRVVFGRSNQRHSTAVDIVSAVSTVSALLPAVAGSVPRQTAGFPGKRRQTGLAPYTRTLNQFSFTRETLM